MALVDANARAASAKHREASGPTGLLHAMAMCAQDSIMRRKDARRAMSEDHRHEASSQNEPQAKYEACESAKAFGRSNSKAPKDSGGIRLAAGARGSRQGSWRFSIAIEKAADKCKWLLWAFAVGKTVRNLKKAFATRFGYGISTFAGRGRAKWRVWLAMCRLAPRTWRLANIEDSILTRIGPFLRSISVKTESSAAQTRGRQEKRRTDGRRRGPRVGRGAATDDMERGVAHGARRNSRRRETGSRKDGRRDSRRGGA